MISSRSRALRGRALTSQHVPVTDEEYVYGGVVWSQPEETSGTFEEPGVDESVGLASGGAQYVSAGDVDGGGVEAG